jgi:hypothetical protein
MQLDVENKSRAGGAITQSWLDGSTARRLDGSTARRLDGSTARRLDGRGTLYTIASRSQAFPDQLSRTDSFPGPQHLPTSHPHVRPDAEASEIAGDDVAALLRLPKTIPSPVARRPLPHPHSAVGNSPPPRGRTSGPMSLGFDPPHPGGMADNSPTFQRWGRELRGAQVPKGRLKACAIRQPSLRDLSGCGRWFPTLKLLSNVPPGQRLVPVCYEDKPLETAQSR